MTGAGENKECAGFGKVAGEDAGEGLSGFGECGGFEAGVPVEKVMFAGARLDRVGKHGGKWS
jgi:hypothetical protein